MRLATTTAATICALALALARQYPDEADPSHGRLAEFLSWAHPGVEICRAPRIDIVERWTGGLRVRYEVPCGSGLRYDALLTTRAGDAVWQVAGGFEAATERVEAALWTVGVAPPPGNVSGGFEGSPLRILEPAQVVSEVPPEHPEAAGRARLIGVAHVELLVDVAADGTVAGARPLRGPEPDLGMRRAASEAAVRWRFRPAVVAGRPVRSFVAIDIPFRGLPPESRDWVHRALFRIEAVASPDPAAAGAPAAADWGLVAAAGLPAAVRTALHEASIDQWIGPLQDGGQTYLMRKRGEIYYAIRSASGEEVAYQVVHRRGVEEGEALRRAIEDDIAAHLAESKRIAYANEAARLMGIGQRRSAIGRLLIHTDVLGEEEVELLGRVVEEADRAHRGFWSVIAPLRPFGEPILVFAFAREGDHDRLHRIWSDQPGTGRKAPAGEYFPSSRILAIPCEATRGHLPVPVLIHEAIHMLDFERVYEAGVAPSKWFEEGLANYFGLSQFDSSLRLDPGAIRRSGAVSAGRVRVQFDPRVELREVLRLRREEGPIPLARLLEAGPADALWGGARSSRAYGAAWTLVHFLLHGEKGRHREGFLRYARLESKGAGGVGPFGAIFGPDLLALEAAWQGYEEGL